MPSNYKRKTQQQGWDPAVMKSAIEAVRSGGMGYSTAAKTFNIPRNTLKRRVLEKNIDAKENKKILGKFRCIFSEEQEQELIAHLLDLEVRFFGVSINDLRCLAYQLADKNNIPHNFNKEIKKAGKDWVAGFRKRHTNITLRKPEATSAARAQAFNKPNVTKFFDILKDVQEKHFHPAHRVFNVDETGLTTVQSKNTKVLALKGRRQVGSLTSAERGALSTIVVCMSAGGSYIPPLVIFPRQRMKIELQEGAPPGTVFACHQSGWMQTEIFTQWFEHFLSHTKPSEEDPVLLVLDGHSTHTKNLEFIERARNNHTTVVCLPPHCSHKLQPLDVSFMAPFNTFYVQAIEKFLRNNPGRVVTQFQVCRLFGEAYLKAATPNVAINGFRKCGIVPLNEDVFSEVDYIASMTTEIALRLPDIEHRPTLQEEEEPEMESQVDDSATLPIVDPQPSTSFAVSPKSILAVPKANIQKRVNNRKKGSAAILTSSPYKLGIELAKGNREKAIEEKERKRKLKEEKASENAKKKEKKDDTKTDKNKSVRKDTSKHTKKVVQDGSKVKRVLMEESEDSDTSDADCFYCGESFSHSKGNEGWIRCDGCLLWAHEACAGCNEDDDEFLCEDCIEKSFKI